eukprot:CAMPEP_0118678198 /NCGR_PEP_ID=MMETSP0800-20121206/3075_1 /TAXON_ID=210618 ORGANISM="Striatella unipunctata, Strain CCMP2910" /NCGR_SAMPLE_ID=MMETSP0800 /ASSEMBLY_ACC=CAM_ASM_000638 /LENGTH=256 /DNA_ID=CAMNT_0006574007 /DNA_START=127 /DNA_END=897 /DNA_ORIENTATION=+
MDRRSLLTSIIGATVATAVATTITTTTAPLPVQAVTESKMDDLPPDAVRSYFQYRVPLQISADFYVFELQGQVKDIDEWGNIGTLFQTKNQRGQGNPSRIERDFVNPMRILGLSMPPDVADDMRDAQFAFEKAMSTIGKATSGIRRDLPVEIDKSSIVLAQKGWEDGRVALNRFFDILNDTTGLGELKSIPPEGPNQEGEYKRSSRRYSTLMKKTKLCQNRGGPALSQAWGQLMVSGYMQDSCGIPDMDDYFFQSK